MPEVYDYSGKSRGYQDDNGKLHKDYAAAVAYRESQARNAKGNRTKSTHTGLVNDKGFGIGNGRTLSNGNVLIPNGGNTHVSNAPITLGGRQLFPMKQGNDIVYVPRGGNNDPRQGGSSLTGKLDPKNWQHPDLPGPSSNRVGQDYDPSTPGIQGDRKTWAGSAEVAPPVDTTQSGNVPIVTRSHNEEYVSKKQQWGDNPKVKAAADKGFQVGQEYLAGDPLAETPAYIRAGSDEWQGREDMKVWMEANPEAAKALLKKSGRREARLAAHEKRMAGIGSEYANDVPQNKFNNTSSENAEDAAYRAAGFTQGDPEARVTFDSDPTENWKKLTGADRIYDYESAEDKKTRGSTTQWKNTRLGDMIGAVQAGIMATRGGKDPHKPDATDNTRQTTPELGNDSRVRGEMIDVEEGAITDVMDQNPGASRSEAVQMLKTGTNNAPQGRSGMRVPDQMVDEMMERKGMKRNQAVDMVRSEEPMAHLEMGKRFSEPGQNREATFMGQAQRAHQSQAAYTGTRERGGMQMPSGLDAAATQKSPLRYEQGNIHSREDEDRQELNDGISAEKFAHEMLEQQGQHMFGADYSPARPKPAW